LFYCYYGFDLLLFTIILLSYKPYFWESFTNGNIIGIISGLKSTF
jgi:hypothetical protein